MPKITALPNTTVPAATDIVPFVDVSGTPTTRKATVANLAASAAFGDEYAPATGALGGPRSAFSALREALTGGVDPVAVTVLGDSTGNGPDEWAHEAIAAFAADYPSHTVRRWLWSDANQCYDSLSTLQTGTEGEPAFVKTAADGLSTPDTVANSITGDLDIRVRASLDNWIDGNLDEQVLAAKFAGAGSRSWRWYVSSVGRIVFNWSTDGTNLTTATTTVIPAFVAGAPLWLRVALDVDNGAGGCTVTFYSSTSGVAWTRIGDVLTLDSTTSVYNSTAQLRFGDRGVGGFNGKLHQGELRNGIDGPIVAAFDAGMYVHATTMRGVTGETWTLGASLTKIGSPSLTFYNGSHPGGTLSYSNNATRFATLTPTPTQVCYINYGHNDSPTGTMADDLETLIDTLRAKYPQCTVVLSQQNPQVAPRSVNQIAAQRHAQKVIVPGVAAAKGCPMVAGVYDAIAADLASYMNADGVHPVAAGSDVWAAIALTQLRTA